MASCKDAPPRRWKALIRTHTHIYEACALPLSCNRTHLNGSPDALLRVVFNVADETTSLSDVLVFTVVVAVAVVNVVADIVLTTLRRSADTEESSLCISGRQEGVDGGRVVTLELQNGLFVDCRHRRRRRMADVVPSNGRCDL